MPDTSLKPYINHLRTYFCEAYYFVKPQKRDNSDKFAPRANKGRLIGYADLRGKIYWIWDPIADKVIRASAVRFNEGPDFKPNDDVEYKAVLKDATTEEEEAMVRGYELAPQAMPTQDVRQQEPDDSHQQQAQPEVGQQEQDDDDSFDWFDAEDTQEEQPEQTQLPTPEPSASPESRPSASPESRPSASLESRPSASLESRPSASLESRPSESPESRPLDDDDLREIHRDAPLPPDHPLAPYTGHAPTSPSPASPPPTESVGGSTRP
jgi:hypothetical protein